MTTDATLGYGTQFQIQFDAVYIDVAEVLSITPPSMAFDEIDITHWVSPGRKREFDSGFGNPGECAIDLNFIPGNETDDLMFNMVNLPAGDRNRPCRIVFSNGVTWSFTAQISKYEPKIPVDDRMTASATFKVSSDISFGLLVTSFELREEANSIELREETDSMELRE